MRNESTFVTTGSCLVASRKPTLRTSAAIAEIQMDRTIAFGALVRAPMVSSLTWADASNPVIVYWASRKPMKKT